MNADLDLLKSEIDGAKQTLEMLDALQSPLLRAADVIATALMNGNKLLTCGNGGSAADASHLATEFVIRFENDRRPFPAISLIESGSTLTAGSNDYGFDTVFARQVQAFGQPGDVLIAFTTSGNSPSVLNAIEAAKKLDVRTIAFLGRDGGKTRGVAEIELIVPATKTRRVQEAHLVLYHAMCTVIETKIR